MWILPTQGSGVLTGPGHAVQGRSQDYGVRPRFHPRPLAECSVSSGFSPCSRVSREKKPTSAFFNGPRICFPGSMSPSRTKMSCHGRALSSQGLYFGEGKTKSECFSPIAPRCSADHVGRPLKGGKVRVLPRPQLQTAQD